MIFGRNIANWPRCARRCRTFPSWRSRPRRRSGVRGDIVKQLALREPQIYVASFNRPNLTYRVQAKSGAYEQTLAFIRARRRESGIVYCQSRKTADSVAQKLNADGVPARAYHAGLTGEERARNQELFLRDEARVVCATIAFGMGINKPNVRFVIHYDLPKNVEGYYQETGRAGRDGLPGECLLLFSAGDVVKQKGFIEEKTDPREQQIAREQLGQMVALRGNGGMPGAGRCWSISARRFRGAIAGRAIIAFRRGRPTTAHWRRRNFCRAFIACARKAVSASG